jgi:hypothetical protein
VSIDKEKLLAFLEAEDARRMPYQGFDLVVASLYAGLAERVRRGDFDDEA